MKAALGLIFPEVCQICGNSLVEGEDTLCLECLSLVPRANIHRQSFNDIHKRLAAPGLPIERAGAWYYYYRDNPYSSLIQKGKYNNKPWICRWLGRMCASEFINDGFFEGIDIILPVGMHFMKRMMRGYNQTYEIARGINELTGIPVGLHLHAQRPHSTQTHKTASQRLDNTLGIYSASTTDYIGKGEEISLLSRLIGKMEKITLTDQHVLVIDDVITTGSTILANCKALLATSPGLKVSVLSIGLAQLR